MKTDQIDHSVFNDVVHLIKEAKNRALAKVNTELVLLYYNVGSIVFENVQKGKWGEKTVDSLAAFIEQNIPGIKGFNRRGLYRMMQFFEAYSPTSECYLHWVNAQDSKMSPIATQITQNLKEAEQIVSPTATQLQITDRQHTLFMSKMLTQVSWSHHLEILSATKTAEERLFYLATCIKEKWSKLELRRQLKSALYERSLLGNRIISTTQSSIPENTFKDPYIFEFLDIPEIHSENDLEQAIIQHLQKFILEIGRGFTYMGRQFHIQVGKKDYYTDLLFFNRYLQCLVLFELKIEEFKPEFLGKLNFYLEALDRDVKQINENPSIGILLCKGKDSEVVEYAMARNISPAIIADYETKLIDKKLLSKKLQELAEYFETQKNNKQ